MEKQIEQLIKLLAKFNINDLGKFVNPEVEHRDGHTLITLTATAKYIVEQLLGDTDADINDKASLSGPLSIRNDPKGKLKVDALCVFLEQLSAPWVVLKSIIAWRGTYRRCNALERLIKHLPNMTFVAGGKQGGYHIETELKFPGYLYRNTHLSELGIKGLDLREFFLLLKQIILTSQKKTLTDLGAIWTNIRYPASKHIEYGGSCRVTEAGLELGYSRSDDYLMQGALILCRIHDVDDRFVYEGQGSLVIPFEVIDTYPKFIENVTDLDTRLSLIQGNVLVELTLGESLVIGDSEFRGGLSGKPSGDYLAAKLKSLGINQFVIHSNWGKTKLVANFRDSLSGGDEYRNTAIGKLLNEKNGAVSIDLSDKQLSLLPTVLINDVANQDSENFDFFSPFVEFDDYQYITHDSSLFTAYKIKEKESHELFNFIDDFLPVTARGRIYPLDDRLLIDVGISESDIDHINLTISAVRNPVTSSVGALTKETSEMSDNKETLGAANLHPSTNVNDQSSNAKGAAALFQPLVRDIDDLTKDIMYNMTDLGNDQRISFVHRAQYLLGQLRELTKESLGELHESIDRIPSGRIESEHFPKFKQTINGLNEQLRDTDKLRCLPEDDKRLRKLTKKLMKVGHGISDLRMADAMRSMHEDRPEETPLSDGLPSGLVDDWFELLDLNESDKDSTSLSVPDKLLGEFLHANKESFHSFLLSGFKQCVETEGWEVAFNKYHPFLYPVNNPSSKHDDIKIGDEVTIIMETHRIEKMLYNLRCPVKFEISDKVE